MASAFFSLTLQQTAKVSLECGDFCQQGTLGCWGLAENWLFQMGHQERLKGRADPGAKIRMVLGHALMLANGKQVCRLK